MTYMFFGTGKHWERSAFESIHRIITEGEATECNSTFGLNPHESAMDQWFEAARKRLVERSMGGGRAPVDTAGAEELEDQIDAAEISTGAFVAPLAVDAIGRSGEYEIHHCLQWNSHHLLSVLD